MTERQADTEALKRLAPFFGKDKLTEGAAVNFARSGFNDDENTTSWLATHPHERERLRYLGLSQVFIGSHCAAIMADVKKRLVMEAHAYMSEDASKEKIASREKQTKMHDNKVPDGSQKKALLNCAEMSN